jgi:tRNA/tmRNA/rRNA uracil-C5-methylase (TrmA/RlmC/RlmD family)
VTRDGEELELDVGRIAHGGHCVARTPDGQVVFVRHALPGERVRARVTETHRAYLRADAVEVLTASADRVEPPCPWAEPGRCGGCDLQHAGLPAQRELKAAVVRELLAGVGRLAPEAVADLTVAALPGPDDGLGWRTRVRYTVDSTGRAGLRRHRSNEVVPIDWCRIAHARVRAVPVLDRAWADVDSVEVVAPATGGEPAVLGTRGRGRPVLLSGPRRVVERAVGRDWSVPASAFWQVHPAAADTLAATVVRLLAPRAGETAWDLYGGVGLFAAALAPHLSGTGRTTLVESDREAAGAAGRNLRDLTTIRTLESDVERALADPRWRRVGLVVLDPPRAGAGRRVVEAIVARAPRAVAYVSCDPAALARDLRTFVDLGATVATVEAYDLFPHTHHVECVALVTL